MVRIITLYNKILIIQAQQYYIYGGLYNPKISKVRLYIKVKFPPVAYLQDSIRAGLYNIGGITCR